LSGDAREVETGGRGVEYRERSSKERGENEEVLVADSAPA
jgi:hypothetical protein